MRTKTVDTSQPCRSRASGSFLSIFGTTKACPEICFTRQGSSLKLRRLRSTEVYSEQPPTICSRQPNWVPRPSSSGVRARTRNQETAMRSFIPTSTGIAATGTSMGNSQEPSIPSRPSAWPHGIFAQRSTQPQTSYRNWLHRLLSLFRPPNVE